MSQPDKYVLTRGKEESKRLEKQHFLWNEAIGYNIHPSIRPLLTSGATLGEIATGTSIWLRDVCSTLPPNVELIGLDISEEQFPPPSAWPSNLSLHLLNALNPLPMRWAGRFDAVHIRLLTGALPTSEDWNMVARNALAMLKPGGALQWDELDYTKSCMTIKQAGPSSSTDALRETLEPLVSIALEDERKANMARLAETIRETGFETVEKQFVKRDTRPWRKHEWDEVLFGALNGVFTAGIASGTFPKEWNTDRHNALVARQKTDLASGAYIDYDIGVITAWKPMD